VSLSAGLASLAFAVAGALVVAATRGDRRLLLRAARALAVIGALALAPFAPEPGARVVLAMAAASVICLDPGLPLLLAACAAFGLFLAPSPLQGPAVGPTLAAAAAALVACSIGRRWVRLLAAGWDGAWLMSAGGATLAATLATAGGGAALTWRSVAAGSGPGAAGQASGLLLGLGLLGALGGSLALAALQISSHGSALATHPVRRGGRRALDAAGAATALGLILGLAGLDTADALQLERSARAFGAVLCAVGALSWAVAVGTAAFADAGPPRAASDRSASLASFMALAAMLAGGIEGWAATGSYLEPRAVALCCGALLTLAAAEATWIALPTGVAAVIALLWAAA
jgi:hypothetical protein